MKLIIPKGATSRILTVFIQDGSSLTGAGLGSLTNSSSIVGGYVREGATGVALTVDEDVTTEGTYQAPSSAAKVRIGTPANMTTGTYELHFHNNLWATGAESLVITLAGATNMAPLTIEIQLTDELTRHSALLARFDTVDTNLADIEGLLDLNDIADAILTRNVSNVEASAGEHTLCTVVLAMLEHSISGSTLTIKRTDGSTTHFTKAVTTNSSADPITGIN